MHISLLPNGLALPISHWLACLLAPPLQVIVMEDRPEYIALLPEGLAEQQQRAPFEPLVIVNPTLAPLGADGARYHEGCLSVPGYQALVERYASVEVRGVTPEGSPLRLQAKGWKARILQHECDHLQVGACLCCRCWLAGRLADWLAGWLWKRPLCRLQLRRLLR